jgi:hypothetical protein
LDTAPRSILPLIATALLATLFLVRGSLHPELNYDVVAYAALAKEMRGAGGKTEAYRELASKVGNDGFAIYVSGPYRERMYRDDGFFLVNLLFFAIRPFYVFLCSMVGSLVNSDVAATYIVSAVAASLAVLLSFVLAGTVGLAGYWRLAVPLTWVTAGGLNIASLSTPDALETLLSLLFVLTSIKGPWKGWRALSLLLIAVLMVATRTDAVLLITILMLLEWMLEPRHRPVASLVFLGALSTYFVIQKVSGNYGYVALLNFNLSHEVVPNLALNLRGYGLAVVHQVLQTLGEDPRYALFVLAVSLLAVSWFRERRMRAMWEGDGFNHRALVLTAALAVYLVARFVLFPFPLSRFLMTAYVLTGILFARAIQPPGVSALARGDYPQPGASVSAGSGAPGAR